jgi:NAD kinase
MGSLGFLTPFDFDICHIIIHICHITAMGSLGFLTPFDFDICHIIIHICHIIIHGITGVSDAF